MSIFEYANLKSKLALSTKDGYSQACVNPYYYYDGGAYAKFFNVGNWDFENSFNPFTYGNSSHGNRISEDLSSGWNLGTVTATSNSDLAPNGEKTATKLSFTSNSQYVNIHSDALNNISGNSYNTTSLQGRTFTFSAWVWSSNKTQICLRLCGKTTGTDQSTNIVTLTSSPVRVSVTRNFTSTDTAFTMAFENRSSLGFGDGGSGDLYVWGVRIDEYATPKKYCSPSNGFIGFTGDSLTAGSGVGSTDSYPSKVMINRYKCFFHVQDTYNFGVAGRTTRDIINDWNTVNSTTSLPNKYLVVWMGTNDLIAGKDVMLTHESLANYCKTARTASWKVIVLTTIARGDADIETQRLIYNDIIRKNYKNYADGLVDVGADTRFSTPPSGANTYYNADKAHLTIVGYQAIADMVSSVLDNKIVFFY